MNLTGLSKEITKLYQLHYSMVQRCYNKKNPSYFRYGARGITVCSEWMDDKQTFYAWAISKGYKIGLTIDRVNNDLGYSPDNCCFVSQKENTRNTSKSKWWFINGVRYEAAKDAAKAEGVSISAIKDWCEGHYKPSMSGEKYHPPKAGCSSQLKYPEQMELDL